MDRGPSWRLAKPRHPPQSPSGNPRNSPPPSPVGTPVRLLALCALATLLGACAAVHAHFRLEPVFVEQAPNHGNPVHQELGYYGPDPSFEVGLWRVRPR